MKTIQPIEIIIMTLLGLVTFSGISGIFLSFTTNSNTGEPNLALAPACLGAALAGLTSLGMVWFRNRYKSASAWLALGIISWFIGLNILGWGGFAVLSPGDNTFVENLGLSMALCFAPGGFLALLGLALYGYDYRKQDTISGRTTSSASAAQRNRRADKLKQAIEYRRHITKLVKQQQGSPFADQLTPIVGKLDRWEARLRQLSARLDAFEADQIIQRDIHAVPAATARLEAQLEQEVNPQLRVEINETLHRQREHQRQLDSLITLMRRTELDVDETLAAIGAIYSQLQIFGAKDIDSQRAKRISSEIEEQNDHLNDLLAAMKDVYEISANF